MGLSLHRGTIIAMTRTEYLYYEDLACLYRVRRSTDGMTLEEVRAREHLDLVGEMSLEQARKCVPEDLLAVV